MEKKEPETINYISDTVTKPLPYLPFKIIPALLATFLPKCPLCLAAYLSIFGGFGAIPFFYSFWVLPVTVFFLAITITLLYYQARRNGRYFPFFFSLTAPLIILTGKFYFESEWLMYTGAAVLIISSIWLSISRKKPSKMCHNRSQCF